MFFGIGVLLILLISSICDIRSKEIVLWQIVACLGMSFAKVLLSIYEKSFDPSDLLMSLMPGIFFMLLAYCSRQSVGYGDGLLMLCSGPALGSTVTVMGMIAGVFACGIISGIMLVFKKVGRKEQIPFVPFLTFGMGVMLFAQV